MESTRSPSLTNSYKIKIQKIIEIAKKDCIKKFPTLREELPMSYVIEE